MVNAESIVQKELKRKQLKKQRENRKYALAEAATKRSYEINIVRLQRAIERANVLLESILRESPTIRSIFENGNFRVNFDKETGGPRFGCDGYDLYIQNKPILITAVLPGSGEDMRSAISVSAPEEAHKWPVWALKYLNKANSDLESLTKEEIVKRILVIRDNYPHWLK